MIEQLRGRLLRTAEGRILLDVSGVGFRVRVPGGTVGRLPGPGQEASLVIRLLPHREEALVLYGFSSQDEAEVFDRLRAVSGVGPGVALNLLSLSVPRIRQAIRDKDLKLLRAAPGVGLKLARRIITELAEALPPDEGPARAAEPASPDPVREQLVSAFANLQFSDRRRIEEVVTEVLREEPEAALQDLFKAALLRLSARGTR